MCFVRRKVNDRKRKIGQKKVSQSVFDPRAARACRSLCRIYVFKYTAWLSGSADGYIFICRADADELFTRYFEEARYLVILYALGFTIFAVPGAIAFAVIRGFLCSVGILRLAAACADGGLTAAQFIFCAFAMALVFMIELLMTAKCVCQYARLQYIAPRPGELIRDAEVRRYSAAFALLCGFMFIACAGVYFAPLLPL